MTILPTDDEVLKLLKPGQSDVEDTFIERKTGYKKEEVLRTIVAFANSLPHDKYGILFLGATNEGDIAGLSDLEKCQQNIRRLCDDVCYPAIKYSIKVIEEKGGKRLLAVIIYDNHEKPYFSGQAFVRHGSSSVNASEEEYKKLIAMRNSKVFEINQWDKNQLVTVIAKGRKLGPAHSKLGTSFQKIYECFVIECNAHSVTLKIQDTQKRYTEPIENIKIAYDDSKYRPMLIVEDSAAKRAI